jgi:hypothetical protein
MAQRSAKTNWAIQADNVTRAEERAFLSNFGELQKTEQHTPNEEHNIHHSVVSIISYYEHSEREGSSFTIRKCVAVCLLFPI